MDRISTSIPGDKGVTGNTYEAAFGGRDQKKESKTTIGDGALEVNRQSGDLNRDIHNTEKKSGWSIGDTRIVYTDFNWG